MPCSKAITNSCARCATTIRGTVTTRSSAASSNGRYLALAMTNPYLDPGETQTVELWYDAPYHGARKPVWSGQVTLQSRHTHLFQCKLPPLPRGQTYDTGKLYFRYTCVDGNFHQTFIVTGDYDVVYPY